VKLCYCDESGVGDEPIAVMVGVVVDASRMHLTKTHWQELLEHLSGLVDRSIQELHASHFYAGNEAFRGINGEQRSKIISAIYAWLAERKHHVVYASVTKSRYKESCRSEVIPPELNTIWRFLGFHLLLAMQKYCQKERNNKGHTIYIFDNKEREMVRFTDIIARPPGWSDEYYECGAHQDRLDQIVDVPYFGNSKDVVLIQLADFFSFFLRRYAEIREGLVTPKYEGEPEKLSKWLKGFAQRSIGRQFIYPRVSRNWAQNLFFEHAPPSIRTL